MDCWLTNGSIWQMHLVCVQAWSVGAGAVSRQWTIHTLHSPDTPGLKIYNSKFTTFSYKKWKKWFFKIFLKSLWGVNWQASRASPGEAEVTRCLWPLPHLVNFCPLVSARCHLQCQDCLVPFHHTLLSSCLCLSYRSTGLTDLSWRSNGWMKKCSSLAGCCKLFSQTTHPSRFWVSNAMVNVS